MAIYWKWNLLTRKNCFLGRNGVWYLEDELDFVDAGSSLPAVSLWASFLLTGQVEKTPSIMSRRSPLWERALSHDGVYSASKWKSKIVWISKFRVSFAFFLNFGEGTMFLLKTKLAKINDRLIITKIIPMFVIIICVKWHRIKGRPTCVCVEECPRSV